MERKQWLTMVYREANIFLERHSTPEKSLTPSEINELDPELHQQLQEILSTADSLEDIIKHSLLKNPPAHLWLNEREWSGVLTSIAAACLMHDVKGIAVKIAEGTLPRTPSSQLLDPI
jgi:hypothetical protein